MTRSDAAHRFGKPAYPKTAYLLIGARGFRAVDSGLKTSLIVPIALAPFVVELRRGRFLDLHWVKDPTYWRRVQVSWVCRHPDAGDIPGCQRGHEPERIDPECPQWVPILSNAVNGADPAIRPSRRHARASRGFAVLDVRNAPGQVQGTKAPPLA